MRAVLNAFEVAIFNQGDSRARGSGDMILIRDRRLQFYDFLTHVYCPVCDNKRVAKTTRCFTDIATQQIDKSVAMANGNTSECLSSSVPDAAPARERAYRLS
jgi:hypothetical protein